MSDSWSTLPPDGTVGILPGGSHLFTFLNDEPFAPTDLIDRPYAYWYGDEWHDEPVDDTDPEKARRSFENVNGTTCFRHNPDGTWSTQVWRDGEWHDVPVTAVTGSGPPGDSQAVLATPLRAPARS